MRTTGASSTSPDRRRARAYAHTAARDPGAAERERGGTLVRFAAPKKRGKSAGVFGMELVCQVGDGRLTAQGPADAAYLWVKTAGHLTGPRIRSLPCSHALLPAR